jgi:WhiB family redox-sensing transcriptional regulator
MAFKMTHEYPEWHEHGVCRDHSQETFFGGEEQPGKKRHRPTMTMSEVQRAKAICNTCPVMLECQTYALENHEEFGVWGGTTKRDRDRWWKEHGVSHMDAYTHDEGFDTVASMEDDDHAAAAG